MRWHRLRGGRGDEALGEADVGLVKGGGMRRPCAGGEMKQMRDTVPEGIANRDF